MASRARVQVVVQKYLRTFATDVDMKGILQPFPLIVPNAPATILSGFTTLSAAGYVLRGRSWRFPCPEPRCWTCC
jgi:hypothetical protein